MPKMGSTAIIAIIDQSASMFDVWNETINAFNEFLTSQKHAPGEASFTLVVFSGIAQGHPDNVITYHRNVPIQNVPPLNRRLYIPNGMTPLRDAVGQTIDELGIVFAALPEEQRPEKVICVIQTDGLENFSTRYSTKDIRSRIEHQRTKYNWQFLFMGADQDAWLTGDEFGLLREQSLSYSNTADGVGSSYVYLNSAVTNYRSATTANAVFDKQDIRNETETKVEDEK